MKTTYYTFTTTTWDDGTMAAGFGGAPSSRRVVTVRRPEELSRRIGGDNVIDLSAWRASEPEELAPSLQDEPDWAPEELEEPLPDLPAPRPRRDHHRAMLIAELVSTLCVAAVAAVLILRVLTF